MSAESDMIAAVNAAEAAVVQLAQAYTNYVAGYRAAASAVYAAAADDRRVQDKNDLEHIVGPERVAVAVAERLRALGATRIIEQPGATMVIGPEWTTALIASIQSHVP